MSTLLCCVIWTGYAQRRKTVFAELGGNGLVISANFDMRLKKDRNDGFGFRAGIGGGSLESVYPDYYYYDNNGNVSFNLVKERINLVTVPLSINYIVGKRRSGFEAGLGTTIVFANARNGFSNNEITTDKAAGLLGVMNLGYRFQPIKRGVMFHVNWTPIFSTSSFGAGWFGLGIGYSFK